MEFLQLLLAVEQAEIRYLFVGGVAVNLHGIIRPTKDIDFMVYLEKKNLTRFINLVTNLVCRLISSYRIRHCER